MRSRQVNLALAEDLWVAAKIAAAKNKISLSEAIRQLLREWVKFNGVEPPVERVRDPHDAIRSFVKPQHTK